MIDLRRITLTIATVALVLAGCGGGSASVSTGPAPDGSPAASQGAGPTPAASAAPTTGGGGGAGGVCDLITADEAMAAFGVASLRLSNTAAAPDSCIVEGEDGSYIGAWSLTTTDAALIYGALAMPGQSVDVAGIGDKAALVENTGFLVLKGDRMISISQPFPSGDLSDDERFEIQKTLGSNAAGRM